MARTHLASTRFALAALFCAMTALTGCEGGVSLTDAPDRSMREALRGDDAPAHRRDAAAKDERATDEQDANADKVAERDIYVSPEERDRSEGPYRPDLYRDGVLQLSLLRPTEAAALDHEFSAGLAEPPQPQVAPVSPTWTPAADAEASPTPVVEDMWPDKAPASGGETVVLRGKNLAGAAQVVFGLTPARIISVDAETDTVTVAAPAASEGKVTIVVTTRDGNYAIAGGFQYYN
jgi:IPT/TIG domain